MLPKRFDANCKALRSPKRPLLRQFRKHRNLRRLPPRSLLHQRKLLLRLSPLCLRLLTRLRHMRLLRQRPSQPRPHRVLQLILRLLLHLRLLLRLLRRQNLLHLPGHPHPWLRSLLPPHRVLARPQQHLDPLPQLRLVHLRLFPANPLRARLKVGRRDRCVHLSPEHREINLLLRGLRLELHRRLRDRGRQYRRARRCRRVAIAVQFLAQSRVKTVRVVRALASRCAHKLGKVAVHSLRVLVAQAGPVDRVVGLVLGANDRERCPRVHVRVRVLRVAQRCCRRCQTKCRPRRSLANLFTLAGRRNVSVRRSISARLKASASCIRRVSVLVRLAVAQPQLP